ncbi:transmembrane protein 87A-like [Haliotis rubra]|uniref:transmembrane protein 87A-like n=1 Tax=Haliotis rubra TaxID=36100 RepID=UPI001EE51368|nr:transmembrane protein 87A-like [Haliotis rubra]
MKNTSCPSKMATCLHLCYLLGLFTTVVGLPELGVWTVQYDQDNIIHGFTKSAFTKTKISLSISCSNAEDVEVRWLIRYSPCAQEYDGVEADKDRLSSYLFAPYIQYVVEFDYASIEMLANSTRIDCSDGQVNLPDYSHLEPKIVPTIKVSQPGSTKEATTAASATAAPAATAAPTAAPPNPATRRRRAAVTDTNTTAPVAPVTQHPSDEIDHHVFTQLWKDGYYVFVLQLRPLPINASKDFKAEVTVRMPGPHGYISAVEYPLEIFYGIMGLVYIVYGLVWLGLLACNWLDLLRVQFWIEGVIVLGMLEKAVFFAEYESIAKSGLSVTGAVIVAELVSSMKRALARMLVIVVSLGFGIVKPRLGETFHKVLCVGVMYFTLGSIEGCMRALKAKSDQSNELMLAAVPLAVLDAVICWWIFSSLVQTTRTLRLRRNIVKLSLYRHFTNTLIFAVLASIAYMIWSITQHKMKACITDWRELWVDEAFWHLLFSVLLLIIMILWRPTANNQRYAFSPLLDAAEDEVDDDTVMNDAFDGMKMRSKTYSNGSPKQKDTRSKSVDDDLRWVEENIPSSLSDKALPSLLDSDEELQNTHFEISKME